MSELKNAFATAFPALDVSPDAQYRAIEAARRADSQASRRGYGRLRLRMGIGVGVASVAVVATMLLIPSNSAASYLRRVRQRIGDAKSAHMIDWSIGPDGKRTKESEIWYQDGKWRIDSGGRGSETIADGEHKWLYQPSHKTVRVSAADGPFSKNPSGFTLSSMIADMGSSNKIKIVDEGASEKFTVLNPIDNTILTLWIDKKTDYPIRGTVETQTRNGPRLIGTLECEFNKPLSASLFAPQFPADVKVVDESAGEAYWQRELSKELAVFRHPDKTGTPLVLHNLQVTDSGDVFLLYSGQANPNDWEVTDDLGNTYLTCDGFQPDMSDTKGNHVKGILVEGKKLDGAWFTPLRPQVAPWKARTLSIRANNVWFKADPEKIKRLPKGAMVSTNEMTRVTTPMGTYTVRIGAPTCEVTPDYMPYMGMGPEEEFDLRREEDEVRFNYFHFRGSYAEAEPYLRDEIAITERHERETGQQWLQRRSFYMMYLNLKLQGRHEEAVQWLKRVLDEPADDNATPDMDRALREEGLH
ncbi:MAG TPA: hypothetical protein VHE55_10205 [Fimbriimonadaceae bacterium]|nr:hypothetical protein [Fimbriimonadaceae bacterium]